MSILNIDDDKLDLITQRLKLTKELQDINGLYSSHIEFNTSKDIYVDEDGIIHCNTGSVIIADCDPIFKDSVNKNILTGIKCDKFTIERSHGIIDPTSVTPNIYCNAFNTETYVGVEFKDINITISSNSQGRTATVIFDNPQNIKFNNTNIYFDNAKHGKDTIYVRGDKFFNLSGLTSNASTFVQYTLDDLPKELMSLFKPGPCKIYDRQKGVETEIIIKDLKKAVSIANNLKRYDLLDHILKVKQNVKFSDIIHSENLPNLNTYKIGGNNVILLFCKEEAMSQISRSGERIPKININGRGRITNEDYYQKTQDGWYVIWIKR